MPHTHRFRLVGDHLAADFVNTLYPPPYGSIHTYAHLRAFLIESGAWETNRLPERLPAAKAEKIVEEALRFRSKLRELLVSLQHKQVPAGVMDSINKILRHGEHYSELVYRTTGWKLLDRVKPTSETWFLAPIASSAAELILELPRVNIRPCADPACIRFFYDRSPTHRRRWCDMTECGNRAKVAAFARRIR